MSARLHTLAAIERATGTLTLAVSAAGDLAHWALRHAGRLHSAAERAHRREQARLGAAMLSPELRTAIAEGDAERLSGMAELWRLELATGYDPPGTDRRDRGLTYWTAWGKQIRDYLQEGR